MIKFIKHILKSKSRGNNMQYQTLVKAIRTDGLISKSKDKLYFIFIYPYQYLEYDFIVLHDGKRASVFCEN